MTSDHDWDDPQAPSDAELIRECRNGDPEAAGLLFERHHEAALTYARKLAGSSRADDIAAEAFTKTLALLGDGKGPDAAFRPYLISAVHNTFVSMIRSDDRYVLVDDLGEFEQEFGDDEAPFTGLVAEAFYELPERWQVVLWHTLIEGDSLEVTAQHLGVTPAAVGSLTYRARRGLSNVLMAKLAVEGDECLPTRELLRQDPDDLSRTQRNALNRHLDECDNCNRLAAIAPAAAKSGIAGILIGGLVAGGGGAYLALRQPEVAAAAATSGIRPPRPRTSRAWVAAPVAGVVIVVVLAVLLGRALMPTATPDVSAPGIGGAASNGPTQAPPPPPAPPTRPAEPPSKPPASKAPSKPPTSAPPTSAPPTSAPPPTSEPPASEPPRSAPPTSRRPTSEPPASVPPTSRPPTSAPPSSAPQSSAPPTSAPPSSAPPTSAPPSSSAPPTSAPPSPTPPTSAPPSSTPPPTPTPSRPGKNLGIARAEHSKPAPGVHRLDVYLTDATASSVVTVEFEGLDHAWAEPGFRRQNAVCLPTARGTVECQLFGPSRDDRPLTLFVATTADELVGRMTISEPGKSDKDPNNNEIVFNG